MTSPPESPLRQLVAVWAPHGVHVSAAASFRGRPSQEEAAAQYPLQVPPEFFSPFDFMESTDQQPGRSRQLYAAMVSYADTAIGTVATSLRASDRWNSTLIVFSAPSISAQISTSSRTKLNEFKRSVIHLGANSDQQQNKTERIQKKCHPSGRKSRPAAEQD